MTQLYLEINALNEFIIIDPTELSVPKIGSEWQEDEDKVIWECPTCLSDFLTPKTKCPHCGQKIKGYTWW